MKRSILCGCALALLSGSVAGCHDDPSLPERVQACLDETIRENHRAWWAQGTWRLHGTGRRTNCQDPALNTENLELGAKPFRMKQGGYDIWLPDAGPEFTVSGQVGERCVWFRSNETVDGKSIASAGNTDAFVTFDFPGEFVSPRSIRGEFEGIGPGSCKSEGDFDLSLDLDPLPPRPVREAGADAL